MRDQDQALADTLLTGQAWADFCDRLKAAGNHVQAMPGKHVEQDIAEGYRYLTRLVRMGLEMLVEHGEPSAPSLFYQNPTLKSGGDNPDNLYYYGRIRHQHEYRLDIDLQPNVDLRINVYAGGLSREGQRRIAGELSLAELQVDTAGKAVVWLTRERREGNWLPLPEDVSTLLIRETVAERRQARGSTLSLSRLGGDQPRPLSPLRMAKELRSVAGFVNTSIELFSGMAERWRNRPNQFFATDQDQLQSSFGDSRYQYPSAYFRLQPGQALQVEFTPPGNCFWNVVLNNHWFESLDYLHHQIHVNPLMHRFPEGQPVRIAIADRDPQWPGWYWLDTTGHHQGIVNVRFVDAEKTVLPSARVVQMADGPGTGPVEQAPGA